VVTGKSTYFVHRFTGPCPIFIVLNSHPPHWMDIVCVTTARYLVQVGDMSNLPPAKTCLTHFPDGF
jgi:hypothetical protein